MRETERCHRLLVPNFFLGYIAGGFLLLSKIIKILDLAWMSGIVSELHKYIGTQQSNNQS